jgi:hypothetical protein
MNKQALAALSMDLKRIALALYNGSPSTASVFTKEALTRIREVDKKELLPYIGSTLKQIQQTLVIQDKNKKAEDALMYSTIVQNYVVHYLL